MQEVATLHGLFTGTIPLHSTLQVANSLRCLARRDATYREAEGQAQGGTDRDRERDRRGSAEGNKAEAER